MSDNNELAQRINDLEKSIFKRLDRLENIVLKGQSAENSEAILDEAILDEAALADETVITAVTVETANIKTDVRPQLDSIAAAVSTPPTPPAPPKETPQWIKNLTDIEWLTSRIGISLLLIGLITSLFWLNNQAWVTDGMRLATGYGISIILLGLGLRLSDDRPSFGQLLAGGGIAASYITTFIGHFYFETIPENPTIVLVFATTILAYTIAVWKQQRSLAPVGLIFGLITPIIVGSTDATILTLVIYICLLLLGPIAIFYTLRWHYLMLLAAVSGWLYMAILAITSISAGSTTLSDQVAIQGGIFFCFVGFGLVPLLQLLADRHQLDSADILALQAANDRIEAEENIEESTDQNEEPSFIDQLTPSLTPHWTLFSYIMSAPVMTAAFSLVLWPDLNSTLWATLMIVTAIVYLAAGYLMGQDKRYEVLQLPFFVAGAILLLLAPFKSSGNFAALLLLIFSIEAAGFALFARQYNRNRVMLLPHLLFIGALFTWLGGILPETIENPFFNLNFLASSLFVASLMLTAWVQKKSYTKTIYQLAAHLIVLPITGFEMSAYFNGETYWLLLHTFIHAGVFVTGLYTNNKMLRYQGVIFAGLAMLVQVGLDIDSVLTWPNLMLFIAAAQVAGVCVSGKLWKDQWLSIGGYILAGIGILAMVIRLGVADFTTPFVGPSSLSTLSMIIALVVVALWYADKTIDTIIGVVAHILALIWLAVQSQDFVNEQGVVTTLWAIYAVGLLVSGLLFDKRVMRNLGIGTILLVVAKLLLFDLENVPIGGRVMLFSGFGVVLLVISYFTRTLWRRDEEAVENE
ncbi:MAG: putative membrane protein [Cellvibrionaceae bacterium]|jgi:uncharacterized membrane protein